MFEDIIHIEIFSTHQQDQRLINELLKSGWKLLSIIQNKQDNYDAFGQIIIGADTNAFEKNNLNLIKKAKAEASKLAEEKYRKENNLTQTEPEFDDWPF
ncbi:hypothetical protein [Enterococcus sp. C50]|uniref:hypothetical protein n=1 Tax=Enterococcus sp. C50 TaxID=3231311 RepID=UPI00349FEAE3